MAFYVISNRQVVDKAWSSNMLPSGSFELFEHVKDQEDGRFDPGAAYDNDLSSYTNFQKLSDNQQVHLDPAITILDQARNLFTPSPFIFVQIHGYNTSSHDAIRGSFQTYRELKQRLNAGGGNYDFVFICFDWPSDGQLVAYLDDQNKAHASSLAFLSVVGHMDALFDPKTCNVSVILLAHSMGNELLRSSLFQLSQKLGAPKSYPLFTETLMVGADVDNAALETDGDGIAIANFSRRVTVYYNANDGALLASRDAKHGGTRRLGRNGPEDFSKLDSRVNAIDCSKAMPLKYSNPAQQIVNSIELHNAYFTNETFYDDVFAVTMGTDRTKIQSRLSPGPQPDPDSFYLKF